MSLSSMPRDPTDFPPFYSHSHFRASTHLASYPWPPPPGPPPPAPTSLTHVTGGGCVHRFGGARFILAHAATPKYVEEGGSLGTQGELRMTAASLAACPDGTILLVYNAVGLGGATVVVYDRFDVMGAVEACGSTMGASLCSQVPVAPVRPLGRKPQELDVPKGPWGGMYVTTAGRVARRGWVWVA